LDSTHHYENLKIKEILTLTFGLVSFSVEDKAKPDRKYKRLELGSSQAYDRSNDQAAVVV
jgi:hypothetical protein